MSSEGTKSEASRKWTKSSEGIEKARSSGGNKSAAAASEDTKSETSAKEAPTLEGTKSATSSEGIKSPEGIEKGGINSQLNILKNIKK